MWSTVAASSAMRWGLVRGRTCTAKPIRMRCVRVVRELAMTSGEANTERSGAKWCSAQPARVHPEPLCLLDLSEGLIERLSLRHVLAHVKVSKHPEVHRVLLFL